MENLNVKIEDQTLVAERKEFKTGSRGFYAGGKVFIEGKKYQVSLSIVEVGSKPKAE